MIQRLPYIIYEPTIYPGLVITNKNIATAPVLIKVYQFSSSNPSHMYFKGDYTETIPAYGAWLPDPSVLFSYGKKFTIIVYGDVDVRLSITTLPGSDITGFGFRLDNINLETVAQAIFDQSSGKVTIGEGLYHYWLGDCAYIRNNVKSILEVIAMKQAYRFLDREDRRLCVYDCVPADDTNCEGHLGAHSGLKAAEFDTGYFTHETNNTQASGFTEIWTDNLDPYATLLDVFDLERNAWFFEQIKKAFPNARIKVDERIRYALIGYDPAMSWLTGTAPRQNNHHQHAHIGLEGLTGDLIINWKYEA